MKKINNTLILITGILLFLVSYNFDQQASLFFKYANFAFLDFVLGVITNFGIVVVVMLLIPSVIFYKKTRKLWNFSGFSQIWECLCWYCCLSLRLSFIKKQENHVFAVVSFFYFNNCGFHN